MNPWKTRSAAGPKPFGMPVFLGSWVGATIRAGHCPVNKPSAHAVVTPVRDVDNALRAWLLPRDWWCSSLGWWVPALPVTCQDKRGQCSTSQTCSKRASFCQVGLVLQALFAGLVCRPEVSDICCI
jgi:hypothetical protein